MRIEKRMVKVLKALAEYLDMTLGDLIEGIVLHAFDGKIPFNEKNLKKIQEIKKVYELDLDSTHSHKLTELNTQIYYLQENIKVIQPGAAVIYGA